MQTESTLLKMLNDNSTAQILQPAKTSNIFFALKDIKDSLKQLPIWFILAWQDLRLRYRRSVLGPLWLTLSIAITVYAMGFLYGHLFKMELAEYFPYLAAGILSWSLISGSLNELTDTFVTYENLIKEVKLAYTLHIHRIVTRNIFIFFHNVIILIPIYILFSQYAKINVYTLMLIPALGLFYVNAFFLGLILAIFATRYRDVSYIIKSLIQVIFFITPVMWNPKVLPTDKLYVVWGNPAYPFVELLRSPLLGNPIPNNIVIACCVMTVFFGLSSLLIFARYRSRIVYWL